MSSPIRWSSMVSWEISIGSTSGPRISVAEVMLMTGRSSTSPDSRHLAVRVGRMTYACPVSLETIRPCCVQSSGVRGAKTPAIGRTGGEQYGERDAADDGAAGPGGLDLAAARAHRTRTP